MLYGFSQTGGLLNIGGRRLLVRGRDLQQLGEFESLWLRMVEAPLDELRLFVAKREDLQTVPFMSGFFKQCRLIWLADREDQKAKLASNPEGRLFSLWQAVRENAQDITLDWLEEAVSESLEQEEHPADFWLEVERAIAIAAGRDELGLLAGMHAPSSGNESTTIEIFMSKLVNEGKWRPDDVKKLTGHAIKLFFSAPQDLDDKLNVERTSPEVFAHIMRRNYRIAATAFLNGRRWDDADSATAIDDIEMFSFVFPDNKKRQIMRCQFCLKEKRNGEQVELRRVEKKRKLMHQVFCKNCSFSSRLSSTLDGSAVWWNSVMERMIEE